MKKLLWAAAAVAAISLASCQKEDSASTKLSTADALQTAVDGEQVAGMYAEMGNEVDMAMGTLKSGGTTPDSTGNRHYEDHSGERKDGCIMKKLTFSNWGIGFNNKRWIKNGAVIVIVSPDKLTDTIKFTGMNINGKRIEGIRVTTRTADGNSKTVKLIGGKITFKDSTTFTCDFTQTWTRTAGSATPKFSWDDEWDIYSKSQGVNRKKVAFSEETTIPLHLKRLWPVFVSGETKKVVGTHTIITNYGDGTNDFIITVTVDGVSKQIDLSQEDKK